VSPQGSSFHATFRFPSRRAAVWWVSKIRACPRSRRKLGSVIIDFVARTFPTASNTKPAARAEADMQSLQKQLASASNSLPCECAKPPQIEAFKAAIDQARSALENDCTALIASSVVKTLFTKTIGAAIAFNRSDSRLENDPEQGALFESIATIEEVVKTPSAEAALLKAGVVKAVPHLLSVLLGTDDDVECREAAVSCLIGAPRPAFAPRPACGPRPAGCKNAHPPPAAELMRQKTIKKVLQKTDFADGAAHSHARSKRPRLTPPSCGSGGVLLCLEPPAHAELEPAAGNCSEPP
jgi:hypothetical protein